MLIIPKRSLLAGENESMQQFIFMLLQKTVRYIVPLFCYNSLVDEELFLQTYIPKKEGKAMRHTKRIVASVTFLLGLLSLY